MTLLKTIDLYASVEDQPILKGLNLEVEEGGVHAVMGRNGSGKSTLANVLMGSPFYQVTEGKIEFAGEDITEEDPSKRAKLGMFLGFQYPVEIPGLRVFEFLRTLYEAKFGGPVNPVKFNGILEDLFGLLEIPMDVLGRSVNEGFSGGEKKRFEVLQLLLLQPKLAILDEIDSGLDVDALRTVSMGIRKAVDKGTTVLIITHYARILEYLSPDRVHILLNGRIVKSGGADLAHQIDEKGYDWVESAL